MASTAIPADLRTSGIAVLTTAASISAIVTGIGWGLLAEWYGLMTTVKVFVVVLGVMVVVGAFLLRVRSRRYG